MTDKEKAIVMAHTGICMLTGDKFQIFHRYIEDIMGRPIMTHEIGWLENEIKEKSKTDFVALCADDSDSKEPNEWIPVSEKYPKIEDEYKYFLVTDDKGKVSVQEFFISLDEEPQPYFSGMVNVIAWMPLPLPYKAESEDKE